VANLKLMLGEAAKRYADKTAVALGEHRLSYAELEEASSKIANALIKMGVRKGDHIAMLLANSPEFVSIYFGVVKVGGIAVPLDIRYKVEELSSIFEDSQPKVLVTESPALELIIPALSRFKSIKHVIDLGSKYEGQFLTYREIINTNQAKSVEVGLNPDDIAQIHYTSGPALHPRGVMLSHRSIITALGISGSGFQQTSRDVSILFALPMHHIFGLVIVVLTAISRGSSVVMIPGKSISNLLKTIEREKATLFMGVPFICHLMINMAEAEGIKYDLSSLRIWGSAGAPLSLDVIKRFKEHYGVDINNFWGLTESSIHVTCQPLDGSGKWGSVGKVLPGWELKVVDNTGRELPQNEPGELMLKGPIMSGIYHNPKATAGAIKDGWLYTGDIGKVDEDGSVFILGRKKDIIIVKGQNIHPGDIENVLLRHPKVAEAAVVGIHDDTRGEVVRAVIRLKQDKVATEQKIRQFCRKHMADYKLPKEILFVDSLPGTSTRENTQTRP